MAWLNVKVAEDGDAINTKMSDISVGAIVGRREMPDPGAVSGCGPDLEFGRAMSLGDLYVSRVQTVQFVQFRFARREMRRHAHQAGAFACPDGETGKLWPIIGICPRVIGLVRHLSPIIPDTTREMYQ